MNTLKTFDGQTAAFIAALVQNIPDLSGAEMQYLIGHPKEITSRTATLSPTLRQVLSRKDNDVELHELDKHWGFMVMQSKIHPEFGIAVSDRNGGLGKGLDLAFYSGDAFEDGNFEVFEAPCGCCGEWHYGISERSHEYSNEKAVKLIRACCATNGIKYFIFHCWNSVMEQGVDGLTLIDPYKKVEMNTLEKGRFLDAFCATCGVLLLKRENQIDTLEVLFH